MARVRLRAHLVRLRASTWIGLEHMHASATWLGLFFWLEFWLGLWLVRVRVCVCVWPGWVRVRDASATICSGIGLQPPTPSSGWPPSSAGRGGAGTSPWHSAAICVVNVPAALG